MIEEAKPATSWSAKFPGGEEIGVILPGGQPRQTHR